MAHGLLGRIDIRAGNSETAHRYGPRHAKLVALGKPLAALDIMIAAHALAEGQP